MTSPASHASVPEKRHSFADRLHRVMALDKAGDLVGKAVLADAMGMPVRTLRSYSAVERRLPDAALIEAAQALEAKCAEISAHAALLRGLAAA